MLLQQEQVLTELNFYVTQSPHLEACRDLFEEGFLSHKKITNMKSEAILSIQEGFAHFEKWYKPSDG